VGRPLQRGHGRQDQDAAAAIAYGWQFGWSHLKNLPERITMGIPVRSDLEFADEVTIWKAMEGRREMQAGPSGLGTQGGRW
jgi:hypothetical protein